MTKTRLEEEAIGYKYAGALNNLYKTLECLSGVQTSF